MTDRNLPDSEPVLVLKYVGMEESKVTTDKPHAIASYSPSVELGASHSAYGQIIPLSLFAGKFWAVEYESGPRSTYSTVLSNDELLDMVASGKKVEVLFGPEETASKASYRLDVFLEAPE
jgi:hypothetical protein